MIRSKADLKEYLASDMAFYHAYSKRDRKILRMANDPVCEIVRYLRFLRKEEYYANCKDSKIGKLCSLYYFAKKNKLGNRLGFKIPRNTFEQGLSIYHHGSVIINEGARIGKNARLHGNNCIGNNGTTDQNPVIGDDLDLGIGAKIIGGVKLGSQVKVGANAVVTKSFEEDGITLVGLPAKKI